VPRRAKRKEDGQVHRDETAGRGNGMDAAVLNETIEAVEEHLAAISKINADAKVACQPHIDQIKALKKAAAEAGIPKKPLSAKIRQRGLLRRAEKVAASLSDAQRETLAEIDSLVELPLFAGLADNDNHEPESEAA
jgi:hypothetical protein